MEQTVWLYTGIIAGIILLAILLQISTLSKESAREQEAKNSASELERHCNLVCDAPFGTLLDVKITLPSGSRLHSADKQICVDYKQQQNCRQCNCQISEYELNLDTDEAKQLFEQHDYYCMMERTDEEVKFIKCVG